MLTTLGAARKRMQSMLSTLGAARKRMESMLATLGVARKRMQSMLTTLFRKPIKKFDFFEQYHIFVVILVKVEIFFNIFCEN